MRKFVLRASVSALALAAIGAIATIDNAQAQSTNAQQVCNAVNFNFSGTGVFFGGQSNQNYVFKAGERLRVVVRGTPGTQVATIIGFQFVSGDVIPANGVLIKEIALSQDISGLLGLLFLNPAGANVSASINCIVPNLADTTDQLVEGFILNGGPMNNLKAGFKNIFTRNEEYLCAQKNVALRESLLQQIAFGVDAFEAIVRDRQVAIDIRAQALLNAIDADIANLKATLERINANAQQLIRESEDGNLQTDQASQLIKLRDTTQNLLNSRNSSRNALAQLIEKLESNPCANGAGAASSNFFPLGFAATETSKVDPARFGLDDQRGTFALNGETSGKINGMAWWGFLSGSITQLDDNRNAADRDTQIYDIAAGLVLEVTDKTKVGAGVSFRTGEVTSDALGMKLDADMGTIGMSVAHNLSEEIIAQITTGYSFGSADLTRIGATGSFTFDVFHLSGSLTGVYQVGEYFLKPNATIETSRVDRDGFVDSIGAEVQGSVIWHSSAFLGFDVSRPIQMDGIFNSITPSLGFKLGNSFRSDERFTLTNGASVKEAGFFAGLNGGLSMKTEQGVGVQITGSYDRFASDIDTWTAGAKLTIPLN